MNKDLFNDLITSCQEVIEYQRGQKQLKTTTIEIPDAEIEKSQLLFQKIENLSDSCKDKVIQYVDELLQSTAI